MHTVDGSQTKIPFEISNLFLSFNKIVVLRNTSRCRGNHALIFLI